MNLTNIKFNKFNDIYGIYLDKLNNEKIYIILVNDDLKMGKGKLPDKWGT